MLLKTLFKATSIPFNNLIGQKFLESLSRGILALSGIGNGAGVDKSGESSAIKNIFRYEKKEHYTVFDIGANKGQFRKMAKETLLGELSNDGFVIYSFEPAKSTFEMLVKNFEEVERPYLKNLGLGKEKKRSTLYYDKLGSTLASQSKRDLSFANIEMTMEEQIEIDTLDSFCIENSISFIDLLKIDVEGYEMDVLQGAAQMIQAKKIKSIMFEFGGTNIDSRTYFKDFYHYFSKLEYKLYRITPLGYLYPLESYKEIYEQFKTTNYLAIS